MNIKLNLSPFVSETSKEFNIGDKVVVRGSSIHGVIEHVYGAVMMVCIDEEKQLFNLYESDRLTHLSDYRKNIILDILS
jgi:hypothetical protein